MRSFVFAALVLLIFAPLCNAQSSPQSKKPEPMTILASAKFIFVAPPHEEPNGQGSIPDSAVSPEDREAAGSGVEAARDPRITPEDREAVGNVQIAIRKWGYYTVTLRRSEADLVVFVRKGRIASAYAVGHAGNGTPPSSEPSSTRKSQGGVFTGAEADTTVDMFSVYSTNPQGTLSGPVWQKSLKDGLDAPELILFEEFKKDVTTAAAKQAKKQISAQTSTP